MTINNPKKIFLLGALLVIMSLIIVACGSPTTEPTDAPHDDTAENNNGDEHNNGGEHTEDADDHELVGDSVRGGLLYDKWWNVPASEEAAEHEHEGDDHDVGGEEPEGDHPLWATQSTNTRDGADSWRCKECHGWDYKGVDGAYGGGSHMTGFPGVFALDKSVEEIIEAMNGGTNSGHDFSTVMAEQDLVDISFFIVETLVDSTEIINDDKSSKGDAAAGENMYGDVCAKCHGPEGNAINFSSIDDPEFLGHLAPDNPWEFVHKVRYGQPGWPMPSAIRNDWSIDEVINVLAYAQTFPAEAFVSGGGQLYDKWWVVVGANEPTEDQPLWATQTNNTRDGKDTWRCKECHGWDYKGVDGAYGGGSHMTGFAGVLNSASLSTDELVAWLDGTTNADHDFSAMGEFGLNAMATFLTEEMADISSYINEDKSVSGDPANGKDMFEGTCAACHGVDGKKINFGGADDPEYLGTVAAGNPWEFIHKVSFGQPGAPMPIGQALGWTQEEILDLLSYVQTLPSQ
ncbi:MAG: c-type cytochrome [Chloroflexota bacterium]